MEGKGDALLNGMGISMKINAAFDQRINMHAMRVGGVDIKTGAQYWVHFLKSSREIEQGEELRYVYSIRSTSTMDEASRGTT
jgi:hypothetical protein